MPVEFIALVASGVLAVIGLAALQRSRRAQPREVEEPAAQPAPSEDDSGVVDMLDVGVIRFDSGLRALRANSAALRLLRLDNRSGDPRALSGRSLMETFVDHNVEQAAHSAMVEGSATVEFSRQDPDERRIHVHLRRGEAGGLVALLEDVTELRRLQRIRSEFIDNLSHELRTPLTTIRLLAETLAQDIERAEVPPRVRERVNKIDVETGHLALMVNELMDLSRIEAGAAELHFDRVNVADLAQGALERLRTFAERQGIVLASDIPDDLPRAWGDEERLGQVLVNLLHNAVKFSPEGSTVTVAARPLEESVAIEVRDKGVGIPRSETGRIFERFYKVDKSRQRGGGGTGLGLAISRHIVEGHGGRIWVESEEGSGSVFTFTVPIAREPPGQSR